MLIEKMKNTWFVLTILVVGVCSAHSSTECICGDPFVTGEVVLDHKWLKSIEVDDGDKYCIVSIISNKHVLTAKDCIASAKKIKLLQNTYLDDSDGIPIKRTIQLRSNSSNVAVLELDTPLIFDKYTGPICLPDSSSRPNLKIYRDSRDLVQETDAYNQMASRKRLVVDPKNHITVKNLKGSRRGCPNTPSTQLYSQQNPEAKSSYFAVGVLHTKDMYEICHETDVVLADNLFAYKGFFDRILKDAKTCPPKK